MSASGLENAKRLVASYKQGRVAAMTPELWLAKKVVDSTLHPGELAGPVGEGEGEGRRVVWGAMLC